MKDKKIKIIVLVLIVSLICIPPTLSIFRKKLNSTGSVDAAKWYVALNQEGISNDVVALAGSSNGVYTLKIVSESEVDTSYTITISGIPSGVKVALNNYDNGEFKTPSSGTVVFNNAGVINYTGSREEVLRTLTFKAESGTPLVEDQPVNVKVDFVQN